MPRSINRSRLLKLLVPPALLFGVILAWALSSPVGSSPDDDFHLASIWCAQGEREGLCEGTNSDASREVPSAISSARCYTYLVDQSGACVDLGEGLQRTERVDATGVYPPVFYAFFSAFSTPDVATSVLVMRAINGLIAVALVTTTFWLLPQRLRTAFAVSLAASLVPLGLFLLGSTNPSSWALLSAATLWVTLTASYGSSPRRRWALLGVSLVAATMGAGARADAAAFAVFAVMLAAILGWRRGVRWLAPAATSLVIVVISLLFYLGADQSASVVNGLQNEDPPLTAAQHVSNLLELPSLWVGAIGGWGLGWLDTPMPSVVWVSTTVVMGAAVFLAIRGLRLRRGLATAFAGAALVVVPFVLLAQTNAVVGLQVQPRYILPLLIILLGVSAATARSSEWWAGGRAYLAAALLTVATAVSLHINIRRYTTGLEDAAVDPGADAEWWWSGVASPLTVWIIGSVCAATLLIFLAWQVGRVGETATRTVSLPEERTQGVER
ncbi:DUF2142 domain-containing protein [Microbacterium sp. NPDC078428]|uniref:DUF2142 domain-containing protein n=1 Tax=Microbacterium sp. NPDC078428 TaxID=3364190 RepID=UPI0037C6F8F6